MQSHEAESHPPHVDLRRHGIRHIGQSTHACCVKKHQELVIISLKLKLDDDPLEQLMVVPYTLRFWSVHCDASDPKRLCERWSRVSIETSLVET